MTSVVIEGAAGPVSVNSTAHARTDLSNVTDADFLAKGEAAGLAKDDLTNVANADLLSRGQAAGLAAQASVNAQVAAVVGGAPAALDTLGELAAALGNDAGFSTTVSTALAARLRFDAAQTLSSGQKTQAAANLGLSTVATTGAYADLTGKPSLSTVATTGAYADLTGKPTLGDAAAKNTGTTAGTLAAGDDSRITGAAQKASNLSDLASATTALTNLGGAKNDLTSVADSDFQKKAAKAAVAVWLANVTALRALTSAYPFSDGATVTLAGYATRRDGGEGVFVYDSSDTTTADNGGTVLVDANSRRWKRSYTGDASVKWFGAKVDGSTDDTSAINACLTATNTALIPAGNAKTTAAVALTGGQRLVGVGSASSSITIASTTAKAVTIADGSASPLVRGLSILRTGTPTNGANGVECLGSSDKGVIDDVVCTGHWIGLSVSTCDTGLIRRVRCNKNLAYGGFQTNTTTYGASQWEMLDVLVDQNSSDGWRVESTASGSVAGLILGTWTSVKSFANGGRGIHIVGNATTPIYDLRLVQAFLGSDAQGGLRIDSYGGKHRINGFFERVGMDPTGPTLATAASHVGPGIEVASHNTDVVVYGSTIDTNSYDGIQHDGGELIVSCCMIYGNGQAATGGRKNGVLSNAGSVNINGCTIKNLSGTAQQFAVATGHGNYTIVGNIIAGSLAGSATALAGGGIYPATANLIS